MNARWSGEANPRPDFFSLTELGSRGKKVGRENCKLEKRMSGATQGFTKTFMISIYAHGQFQDTVQVACALIYC